MTVSNAKRPRAKLLITLVLAAGCDQMDETLSVDNHDCESIPRPENARLNLSAYSDDWYQVYETADGVYSIVEPYQFQETVSHLIVGEDRALLFDTGIGLLSIKAIVEKITQLPVTVLNSHTHYDHVGGNWEFANVLAIDSDYTRTNMRGFGNGRIAEDFLPEAFCKGAPKESNTESFYTRPWKQSRYVKDGEILELGGRALQVLHVPGHTPDAVALLDAANRLLFTGDSWYDASLWLFVPETSLNDYEASVTRLAEMEGDVDYLLGAHNSARVDAGRLQAVVSAVRKLRAGDYVAEEDDYKRLVIENDGVSILTAQAALDGEQGDISKGGSGLDSFGSSRPDPVAAEIAWTADGGFCEPETVLPLPDDTLLVSNVCGYRELGTGFLTLLDAHGQAINWRRVKRLDSPLGMALSGDRLHVVDNNRVRVFRWPGFEILETIEIETFAANDIAAAPDGTIYVTDSAKHQVVQRLPDGTQSILGAESQFRNANGLELYENSLYVGGERLWRIDLESGSVDTIGPDWLTDIDGIEFESAETLQLTPVGGPLIRYRSDEDIEIVAGQGISSANHGYSSALELALIPTGYDNTVIAIRIPQYLESESDR